MIRIATRLGIIACRYLVQGHCDNRYTSTPEIADHKIKAIKADRRVRTIAGRLVRELERNLGADSPYHNQLALLSGILNQRLIIGALSFRKEHDVRTLVPALDQVSRLTNRRIKILAGDRGLKSYSDTTIEIPSTPKARDSRYERAGIEPAIGHLKSDHSLGRNFYKRLQGDAINIMLASAAYNFQRAMRALWLYIEKWICDLIKTAAEKIENPWRLKISF